MSVTLLVDNDVVIKLARMDAYIDAMTAVGIAVGEIGSLRVMLRYMGIADEQRRMARTESNKAEADRLNVVLHSIVEVELTKEESEEAATVMALVLANGLDLNAGELMLLIVAARRGGIDVATGDKRAIRSLPGLAKLWPVIDAMRERVICFEQIFAKLSTVRGVARVRTAISMAPRSDKTVAFVYEQTSSGGSSRFVAGLEYVMDDQIRGPAPGWLRKL